MTDGRQSFEILQGLATATAVSVASGYILSWIMNLYIINPEQERIKKRAKEHANDIWIALDRKDPIPAFNEFELAIINDVILPMDIPTSLDDIGGLDTIKATIWETVLLPFLEPEIFEEVSLSEVCIICLLHNIYL